MMFLKRKSPLLGALLLLSLFILASCIEEQPEIKDTQNKDKETVFEEQEFTNSYTVESMGQFYGRLLEGLPSSARLASVEEYIQPTHDYIKFLPKNSGELDTLTSLGIELFPYPMDYGVGTPDEFYENLSEEDSIIWQYAVVDKNITIPDFIEHELISEEYMPNLDDEPDGNGRVEKIMVDDEVSVDEFLETCALLDNHMLDSLLIQEGLYDSIYVTDTLSDETGSSNARIEFRLRIRFRIRLPRPIRPVANLVRSIRNAANRSKNGPGGRITVEYPHPATGRTVRDGVANVEVVARTGLRTRSVRTDRNGNYKFPNRIFGATWYSIKYVNRDILIRRATGVLTAESYGGFRALNRGWDHNAKISDWAGTWSCIMNAAYDYYNVICPETGISRPPYNLRIIAKRNSVVGRFHAINLTATSIGLHLWQNDMIVRRIGGNDTYATVYGTTIHEFGHAAHWNNQSGGSGYSKSINMIRVESRLRETWADAVMQYAQHRKFYSGVVQDGTNETTPRVGLHMGPWRRFHNQCDEVRDERYLHMFYPDMIDDYNQGCLTVIEGTTRSIRDEIVGIPLVDIWRGLRGARNWNQWRDNIIALHPDQRNQITNYFAQF